MLDDNALATQPPMATPTCPICFHPTRAGAGKHQLACAPCGHMGGFACLLACAQTHAACAVCRAPVRASDIRRLWLPNAVDACESSEEETGEEGRALTSRDANASTDVVWGPWKRARTDERRAVDRVGGVGSRGGEATVRVTEVSSRSQCGSCRGRESGHASVAPDGKSLLCVEYRKRNEWDWRVRLYRSSLSRRSEMTLFERSYECSSHVSKARIVVPCDPHRAKRQARHFILLLGREILVFMDSTDEIQMVYHLEVDDVCRELASGLEMRYPGRVEERNARFVDAAWSTSPNELGDKANQTVFYVTTRIRTQESLDYAVHRIDMITPKFYLPKKVYFNRYKYCSVRSDVVPERPAVFLCSNNGLGAILTLDELWIAGQLPEVRATARYESCITFRSLRTRVPCVPLATLLKPTAGYLGHIQGFFASKTSSASPGPYGKTPDCFLVCFRDGERTRVERIPRETDDTSQQTHSNVFDLDARHFDDALQKMSFCDPVDGDSHLHNLIACNLSGNDVFVGVSYQPNPKKEEDCATKLFVYTFGAREDATIVPLSERNDEPLFFDVVRKSAYEATVYVRLAAQAPVEGGSSSERSITEKVFTIRGC